ncbi:hypothetical protein VD0003_g6107 [Verticillium dahliae]|nr:hypothetical protein VD0003_g6107 [Verticillium dahliae]
MAEAAATALGVIGFLGQLFDGCVRAYGYFTTAARLDQDSARLVCKVRIEEMRLVVWGREWGVAEGRLERESTPQMAALAGRIMEELHATVTDFVKLRDRYGIVEEAAAKSGLARGEREARERDGGKERGWRKELTLRAKWVIADKEKFTALLRDLKDFNDGLDQLFPPSRLPSLHRAWRHSLLDHAQRDVAELALLASSAEDSYPQLRASAALKKLRINLDLTPQAQFRPTFAFRAARADLTLAADASPSAQRGPSPPGSAPRSTPGPDARVAGRHSAHGPVLVEWVEYDREDPDERFLHLRRLDDLARMLRSASARHPDLHTPDCVGYVDDAPAHPRYGLVYKLPPASCPSASLADEADADAADPAHTSLHALIAGPLRTPDLTARIDLARTLAVALWSLHSLDWLHKSLCSANILFIRPAASPSSSLQKDPASSQKDASSLAAQVPCIEAPHLVGFDASRPDLDPEMSVNPRNPSIVNLYRDPRVSSFGSGSGSGSKNSSSKNSSSNDSSSTNCPRQPYRKSHDIYSLGLVLLEIGWWKVLSTYYKPHYSAERWRDKVVLPVLVPGLASKTGRLYRDVVERCLTVHEDMSSSEAGEVMEWVVATLESIRT